MNALDGGELQPCPGEHRLGNDHAGAQSTPEQDLPGVRGCDFPQVVLPEPDSPRSPGLVTEPHVANSRYIRKASRKGFGPHKRQSGSRNSDDEDERHQTPRTRDVPLGRLQQPDGKEDQQREQGGTRQSDDNCNHEDRHRDQDEYPGFALRVARPERHDHRQTKHGGKAGYVGLSECPGGTLDPSHAEESRLGTQEPKRGGSQGAEEYPERRPVVQDRGVARATSDQPDREDQQEAGQEANEVACCQFRSRGAEERGDHQERE